MMRNLFLLHCALYCSLDNNFDRSYVIKLVLRQSNTLKIIITLHRAHVISALMMDVNGLIEELNYVAVSGARVESFFDS